MKLLFVLVIFGILGYVGFQLSKLNKSFHKHLVKFILTWRYPLIFLVFVGIAGLFYLAWYSSAFDGQCIRTHKTTVQPPAQLTNHMDYLKQGDYDFARGNCLQAIADYSQAIVRNQNYAEAYNNRAYTYMRMRDYALALPDLNMAISLRPDYINALMNRGDIYNSYYTIDKKKAIADYDRVIATGRMDGSNSVCGHRLVAVYELTRGRKWDLFSLLEYIFQPRSIGCTIKAP